MLKRQSKVLMLVLYYAIVMIMLTGSSVQLNLFTTISGGDKELIILYQAIFIYTSHLVLLIMVYRTFRDDLKKAFEEVRKHSGKHLLIIVVGFAAMIAANIVVNMFVPESGNQEKVGELLSRSSGIMLIWFYLTTMVIGPINEEFIFRHIMIGEGKKYIKVFLSVILSSILFAFVHVNSMQDMISLVTYIPLGLIHGIVYYKSDNIITNCGLHIIYNVFGILMMLAQ